MTTTTNTTGEAMTYHTNYNTEAFPPRTTGMLTAVVPQKRGDDYTIRIYATNVDLRPDGSIAYNEVKMYESSRGEYAPRVHTQLLRALPETVKAYGWLFTPVYVDPRLSENFVSRHDWTSTISECD
jgi:hypothetical protein